MFNKVFLLCSVQFLSFVPKLFEILDFETVLGTRLGVFETHILSFLRVLGEL